MKELQQILILPEAQVLLERILASCISRDDTKEQIKFPKNETATLHIFFKKYPSPAAALAAFCKAENRSEIGREEVIELFSGPIHAQAVKEWVNNPRQIIIGTSKPFLERLDDLSISLEPQENKATFTLFDLAMPCHVNSKNGRKITVKCLENQIENYALPHELEVQKGDWVLCHMGAVITKLNEKELQIIHRGHQKIHDKYLFDWIKDQLLGKKIDCQHFCPDKKTGHLGFNLTKWNLNRL